LNPILLAQTEKSFSGFISGKKNSKDRRTASGHQSPRGAFLNQPLFEKGNLRVAAKDNFFQVIDQRPCKLFASERQKIKASIFNTFCQLERQSPVHPPARYGKAGVKDNDPEPAHGTERRELLANAARPRRMCADKKRHIRAQRGRERNQLSRIFFEAKETVDRAQSRGGIAAAAAEPSADRDVFSNMNMERLLLGSLTEQKRGRSIREILFSGRDERVIARYREAFLCVPASPRPGDLDFVVQSDGNHDRVQEMVTVAPLPHHAQG